MKATRYDVHYSVHPQTMSHHFKYYGGTISARATVHLCGAGEVDRAKALCAPNADEPRTTEAQQDLAEFHLYRLLSVREAIDGDGNPLVFSQRVETIPGTREEFERQFPAD
jgi:hypothetical protein